MLVLLIGALGGLARRRGRPDWLHRVGDLMTPRWGLALVWVLTPLRLLEPGGGGAFMTVFPFLPGCAVTVLVLWHGLRGAPGAAR